MAKDLIRYDLLVQEALRDVVRRVLTDAAKNGLPGDHHFYVTFRTQAAGVRLSDRMKEKYPEEMNVILQHQFWDLSVSENAFEVGLSFGGVAERLHVPFASICGFYDPSVEFALKFEMQGENGVAAANESDPKLSTAGLSSAKLHAVADRPKPALALAKPSAQRAPARVEAVPAAAREATAKLVAEKTEPPKMLGKGDRPAPASGNEDAGDKKVVSIDAFRKKP